MLKGSVLEDIKRLTNIQFMDEIVLFVRAEEN
jgi:hypothetical protein